MALPDQRINTGLFQPTTAEFDVQQLYTTDVNSEAFKELLVRLARVVNNVQLDSNKREAALYLLEEFVTGQLWHNGRASNPNETDPSVFSPNNQIQGFRKVLFITSDPWNGEADVLQAGTKNVPHGLTPLASTSSTYTGWKITSLYGGATNTVSRNYYPLNFSGPTYLSAYADATNIVIVNNTGVTFDKVEIVFEYIKF